jgi:seryl-tRNA synthetase
MGLSLPIEIAGLQANAAHVAALVSRGYLHARGEELLGLSGPALELSSRLVEAFKSLETPRPEPRQYPIFLAPEVLAHTDYFLSFPHQATFAVGLDGRHLDAFVAAARQGKDIRDQAREAVAGPRHVLSPAVCYHCYAELAGQVVGGLRTFSATGRCFRNEAPDERRLLARQGEFSMHEYILVGDSDEVRTGRERMLERVIALARRIGLCGRVVVAHDPFYGSVEGRARRVVQDAGQFKVELVVDGGGCEIAIASFNLHEDYFGRAFGINLASGQPVHTACVAFGVERWIRAVVATTGVDPERWWAALQTEATP